MSVIQPHTDSDWASHNLLRVWLVAQSVLLLLICPDTCPVRSPWCSIGHLWCFSIWIFQTIICWFGVEQVQWAQLELWGSLLIKTSSRDRGAAAACNKANWSAAASLQPPKLFPLTRPLVMTCCELTCQAHISWWHLNQFYLLMKTTRCS